MQRKARLNRLHHIGGRRGTTDDLEAITLTLVSLLVPFTRPRMIHQYRGGREGTTPIYQKRYLSPEKIPHPSLCYLTPVESELSEPNFPDFFRARRHQKWQANLRFPAGRHQKWQANPRFRDERHQQ